VSKILSSIFFFLTSFQLVQAKATTV